MHLSEMTTGMAKGDEVAYARFYREYQPRRRASPQDAKSALHLLERHGHICLIAPGVDLAQILARWRSAG